MGNSPSSATWKADKALTFIAKDNTSGSGWPDVEGHTMSYTYVGFGSFQLAFFDNHLKWRGFGGTGYFDGITSMVDLQISKVGVDAGDVYFLSWPTPGGGDNVCISLKDGTVFAHLWSGTSSITERADFAQIHGEILSTLAKDASLFPDGGLTLTPMLLAKLLFNSKKYSLPFIDKFEPTLVQAHHDAKQELTGKVIKFACTTIKVAGDTTRIITTDGDDGDEEEKNYRTHVTKVKRNVYFLSWLANTTSGMHVVIDTSTKKVYCHILDNGKDRKEQIYDVDIEDGEP